MTDYFRFVPEADIPLQSMTAVLPPSHQLD